LNPQEPNAYPEAVNYYPEAQREAGLKYRLDGDDVVLATADELRGLTIDENGTRVESTGARLLSEEGVQRAIFFLRGAVNKINHLTKYGNEERINDQMRAQVGGFLRELTKNMKRWAPPGEAKVRNPRLVLRALETKMYQSFLRGNMGFEAELTGKNWSAQEIFDNRRKDTIRGRVSEWFGGGGAE
jgi:hypothetical protein